MPWLGDGTWVADPKLARDIVQGRTNYRPWSGDLHTATPRLTDEQRRRLEQRKQDRKR